jgi:hypothetical protein
MSREAAEALRIEGNALFAKAKYAAAIEVLVPFYFLETSRGTAWTAFDADI